MADKFRKVSCLNVYGRKRGRPNNAYMTSIRFIYMSIYITIPIFYLANFDLLLSFKIQSYFSKHKLHLFDPPVYEIDCFNTDNICRYPVYYLSVSNIFPIYFSFLLYYTNIFQLSY